ncbi:MAG: hypothetical protein FWD14_07765 [Treponema sp.]|nr:hypothetical protein [Treponema sp.]
MHHLKKFGIITLIFCFLFLVFSCITNTDFEINAEAVPEGLLIRFKNIPAETSHMFISISTTDDTEDPASPLSIISSYAALTNTNEMDWVGSSLQLEKVKQTGTILFPFVEPGKNYHVSAYIYTLQEREQYIEGNENPHQHYANAEVTANGGIYIDKENVKLELNNDKSAVTLTSQPIFPQGITFADQIYSYSYTIQVDNGSLGVGDHHIPEGLSPDGLTWVFEPQMSAVNLRAGNYLEEGFSYPAWASASVNILYDEILWYIDIAKTELGEFRF